MINPQEEKGYLTVLSRTFGVDEKIDELYYMHLASNVEPIKIREICSPNYLEELWVIKNYERIRLVRIIRDRLINYDCYRYDWIYLPAEDIGGYYE